MRFPCQDRRFETEVNRFEEGDVADLRANYAGNVKLIDDEVSRIFAAISARGEMANTVICLASDHGKAHDSSWNLRLRFPEMRSESIVGRRAQR